MPPLMPHLAEARARESLRASRLPFQGRLERASSTHNEIHLSDHHVVRVGSQLNHRLRREVNLYPHLPHEPWSPTVVGAGTRAGTDFVVVERKPGLALAHAWPFLSMTQRRAAVANLADCMRAIHTVETPPDLPHLEKPLHLFGSTADKLVEPLLVGLEKLAADPHADAGIVADARAYVEDNSHHLDDFDQRQLIHGDLTFENVMWDGHGISGVIDFEWCRGAPADLDLDVLLRCCALPRAHVALQFQERTRPEDYAPIPGWLAEDYPELFSHPNLVERLTLYTLAFEVRDLLEVGHIPDHRSDVDDIHPYNRFVNLVCTGGHVSLLLERAGLVG